VANVGFRFDEEKGKAAIVYLASRNLPELSKGKICKLIFLADKHHLVRFGRPVTGDRICAMPDGPVPSNILNILNAFLNDPSDPSLAPLNDAVSVNRIYRHPHFHATNFTLGEFLSESDLESLDAIVKAFGDWSFSRLRAITHEMTAYKNAREAENRIVNNPTMSFEDMFEDDDEALTGAFEEMIENNALREAFGPAF
jgi:uncharacterized phage-associated protein